MTFNRLLQRWLPPAPDSIAADAIRRGRSPWVELVHLLWSAWVFITPAFAPGGYSGRWWLLTAVSYPLFVAFYLRVLLAPAQTAWRYAAAMIALCLVLLPWYPSGMSYFVFGCVFLHAHWRGTAWAVVANACRSPTPAVVSWLLPWAWTSCVPSRSGIAWVCQRRVMPR